MFESRFHSHSGEAIGCRSGFVAVSEQRRKTPTDASTLFDILTASESIVSSLIGTIIAECRLRIVRNPLLEYHRGEATRFVMLFTANASGTTASVFDAMGKTLGRGRFNVTTTTSLPRGLPAGSSWASCRQRGTGHQGRPFPSITRLQGCSSTQLLSEGQIGDS